jgi:alpha-L-rhamnosidase
MILALLPAVVLSVVTPSRLRVEYMKAPHGVDVFRPRFSWALSTTLETRAESQSAYELNITALHTLFSWSSGKVHSNVSQNVPYVGQRLPPDTTFSWSIRAYDAKGQPSAPVEAAFSTGLYAIEDWSDSAWVGFGHCTTFDSCGFQARTEVTLDKTVARAVAYVAGAGYYKLFLNGNRVSTHELGAFTTYTKRIYYETFDVTESVRATAALGQPIVIAATVGGGWYALLQVGQPALKLKLSLLYTDGTTVDIVSDGSWLASPSPVLYSGIYSGEIYDSRRQTEGWKAPGFKPGPSWSHVQVLQPAAAHANLTSHAILPPIGIALVSRLRVQRRQ